jgi:hypothetical protein
LALYKYFLSSHTNLDLGEVMVKKHHLFLAVLCSGEGSEEKIGCPLDQVILADSLLSNGQWRKASLVRSFVTTALWSLRAIDAHWCRHTLSQDENYVPFSLEDLPHFTVPDVPAVEPSSPTNANTYDIDPHDGSGDEQEDEENGRAEVFGDGEIDHDPSSGFGVGSIDADEIEETLQRISKMLDTPDNENLATGNSGPFNASATME